MTFTTSTGRTVEIAKVMSFRHRVSVHVEMLGGEPTPEEVSEIDRFIRENVLEEDARLSVVMEDQDKAKRDAEAMAWLIGGMERN